MNTYTPLTENTVLPYLFRWSNLSNHFNANDELTVKDLADGNVNLVFRVQCKKQPSKSIIVKQALPFARRYPDFKMPLERAALEYGILSIHNERCPGLAPKSYHYDPVMFVNIMEDLNSHHIMRNGIMKQTEYPKFASDIGTFLARSVFYTTCFFLDSALRKELIATYTNPVLCKVSEDLVFTFPFRSHATNRFPEKISGSVEALWNNEKLQTKVLELKTKFMTQTESLIHGDLHTGSIMLNQSDTKVIDPEFGFMGPIGYDIGNVLGNLAMAHTAQAFHCKDKTKRTSYQAYLAATLKEAWETFAKEWRALWKKDALPEWRSDHYLESYLQNLEKDSLGYAACEIIRRTIGMAHIPELDNIDSEESLALVSDLNLSLATKLLTGKITSASGLSESL